MITDELIEVGRKAIEDALVEWRDSRLSMLNCGNGFVIRESNGDPSHIIRFRTDVGLKIALRAMFPEQFHPNPPEQP